MGRIDNLPVKEMQNRSEKMMLRNRAPSKLNGQIIWEKQQFGIPTRNEILARFEHALAVEMIRLLKERRAIT